MPFRRLLFYEGKFLKSAVRTKRMTEEEAEAAVRRQGMADLADVGAVVLETDGSMTVVPRAGLGRKSALPGAAGQRTDDGRA